MTDQGQGPVVVWFRRDLRLTDNQALAAAAETGRAVIPCYIFDAESVLAPGTAARWWLYHSLAGLARDISLRGGQLVVRAGDAAEELRRLAAETGACAVYASELPTPQAREIDDAVASGLRHAQIRFERLPGSLLFGTDPVRTKNGTPFRVFTPFYKACLALPDPGMPRSVPGPMRFYDRPLRVDELDSLALVPVSPNWAHEFGQRWHPGEAGAAKGLERFLEAGLGDYPESRDRPDLESTSMLSPHLAFGELSPRQAWYAVQSRSVAAPELGPGAQAWLRQLVWREFSYYLLSHWPRLPAEPLRQEFAEFPWADDREGLTAWQQGRTGYPLVDAGMRELWETGWMHNRVRMVAASFLVKDLLIPWQCGARWFEDTLLDADVANNSASWQWVAGCGTDAAPYFRIFNPVAQGRRFDPAGSYVRRYVPEIASLPDKYLHSPQAATGAVLEKANLVLGRDYPRPIVDHADARRRALAGYASMRR